MLKLVRQALTAAVLIAIALRLRRRARLPRPESAPPAPPPARRSRRAEVALLWSIIALAVAATLVLGLMPAFAYDEPARMATLEYEVESGAITDTLRSAQESEAAPTGAAPTGAAATPVPDPSCASRRRPVDARRVPPDVKRDVDRQWLRIERWLKAKAPRTYRTLGGPGKAYPIAVVESRTGLGFPDDLRASLLRHNGSRGPAVFGFLPRAKIHLSVSGIRDLWRRMCREDRTVTGPDPRREPWNGLMIPIVSFTSPPGGYAVVNSTDGTVGWDDGVTGMAPRIPTTRHLLRRIAYALEHGTPLAGRRPTVTSGTLRWVKAH
ncbi:MAG: hypothetical protein HOV96_13980 [Nonomuraea sp.]|nr:hypothetical protein [Nonomuraea sp.]